MISQVDTKKVDFVLVYTTLENYDTAKKKESFEENNVKEGVVVLPIEPTSEHTDTTSLKISNDNADKRKLFEENIVKEGLIILPIKPISEHPLKTFVKIHIPDETLYKYAEIKKIKIQMVSIFCHLDLLIRIRMYIFYLFSILLKY